MPGNTGVVWGLLMAVCACGGGGDDGPGTGGDAPRLWDRQAVQESSSLPGLALTGDAVDIVYVGAIDTVYGVVWQQLGGTPELIEATSQVDRNPRVGRDASGTVHVVWATTNPDEVRYAARTTAGWTVESIATDRYRPDLVVAADGTPHVAFVDEETGNGMAYYAIPGASGWDINPVHGTRWIAESQVGIDLGADGLPVMAAPDSEGNGVWFAAADANGTWTIEALATDHPNGGVVDVAAGDAGVAVAFKDGSFTLVAWRPAGSSEWTVEEASHHDSSDASISVAVSPVGPLVVSDVDVQYPNGLALLERTASGWTGQLLGSSSCGDGGHAMAIDAAGQPAIALTCGYDTVYYMTVEGTYPDDWTAQCEAAAAEMCEPACTCGVDGEDCCWGVDGGSTCTSSFGCPGNAIGALCGDPTVSPADLQACRDELGSLTCSVDGPLDLSGACAELYQAL